MDKPNIIVIVAVLVSVILVWYFLTRKTENFGVYESGSSEWDYATNNPKCLTNWAILNPDKSTAVGNIPKYTNWNSDKYWCAVEGGKQAQYKDLKPYQKNFYTDSQTPDNKFTTGDSNWLYTSDPNDARCMKTWNYYDSKGELVMGNVKSIIKDSTDNTKWWCPTVPPTTTPSPLTVPSPPPSPSQYFNCMLKGKNYGQVFSKQSEAIKACNAFKNCKGNKCKGVLAPVIDGGWSILKTACDETCGDGFGIPTRTCTNPKPSGGGKNCVGFDKFLKEKCNRGPCKPLEGAINVSSTFKGRVILVGDSAPLIAKGMGDGVSLTWMNTKAELGLFKIFKVGTKYALQDIMAFGTKYLNGQHGIYSIKNTPTLYDIVIDLDNEKFLAK